MTDLGITLSQQSELNLFAGSFPRVEVPIVIVTGAGVLVKGTVLGKITGTVTYDAYSNADNTGLEVARLILAEDVDATNQAVNTTGFASGEFNEDALTGLDDAAKVDFEGTPIFIKKIY